MVPELNCVYLILFKCKIRIKIQCNLYFSTYIPSQWRIYQTHNLSIKSHEIVCLNRRLNKVYTGLKCIISQFNSSYSNTCQENHSHFQVWVFTNTDVGLWTEHTCKLNIVMKDHKLGCLLNKYKRILEDNFFWETHVLWNPNNSKSGLWSPRNVSGNAN